MYYEISANPDGLTYQAQTELSMVAVPRTCAATLVVPWLILSVAESRPGYV